MNVLKILSENGEMRNKEITEILYPEKKRTGATSNLLGRLQGMLCVVNTRYGYYKISEVGKAALMKYLQIEDISNDSNNNYNKLLESLTK
jgi:hypothetical protein